MNNPHKLLCRLETPERQFIGAGGAQFNPDGTGFFITQRGAEMPSIAPGMDALICAIAGDVIARVSNVELVKASCGLPPRYIFAHNVAVGVMNSSPQDGAGLRDGFGVETSRARASRKTQGGTIMPGRATAASQ